MTSTLLLAAALAAWAVLASAQPADAPPPPAAALAPAPPAPTEAASNTLHVVAGTSVLVELTEEVTSRDRTRGDKFAIRLATPIIVDGRIAAPAGASGVGEVVYAEKGHGGGAPGKLVLAVRYVDVGDVRVRLNAFHLAEGGDMDFRELQMASQAIGPAVFFINGHNIDYAAGTRAKAKVAEDVVLPAGEAASASADPASPVPRAAAPTPLPQANTQDAK